MFYNFLYLISGFNRYVRLCHVRTKPGKLAIIYLCVRETDLNHFASIYDFYIKFWSCPNGWYFFL